MNYHMLNTYDITIYMHYTKLRKNNVIAMKLFEKDSPKMYMRVL